MSLEQSKAPWRSLRFRLTAWNATVVLLAVVIALLGVREGLRLTLIDELDLSLLDDTTELGLAVEELYPNLDQAYGEMERKIIGHKDRDLFVQFLDPTGKTLFASRNAPAHLDQLRRAGNSTPAVLSIDEYRLAERRLFKSGMPEFTLRVGSSLVPLNDDVAKLTDLMIVAVLVVLAVAPLGGYWLAGRATHPLARIIATTARLRPSHMEERLPIRGTDDELDRLSTTINRFLDLIGDYLHRNREFVANAAHELRSPLAAIQSSVEVTLHSERSIQEYQELLDDIVAQCGQLGGLVNQLLLLAETDIAGLQIQRRPVPIDRLIVRSVEMFRGATEERGIQLSATCPNGLVIEADGDRLRQVINNLIDNSLKFTDRGGQVQITVERDELRRQAVLVVADTGAGIAAEDLPHVFERFYRGDKSRDRGTTSHGNGLGLSICQAIVSAHEGSIAVTSFPGEGSRFVVRLPLAKTDLWMAEAQRKALLASVNPN
jgi:signal transduction histidine kinase